MFMAESPSPSVFVSMPVAIKSSHQQFLSMVMDDDEEEDAERSSAQTYVKLQAKSSNVINFRKLVWLKLLNFWKYFVLFTIFFTYLQNSCVYLIWRPKSSVHIFFGLEMFYDIIFAVDIVLNFCTMIISCRQRVFVIFVDVVLVFPFWMFYMNGNAQGCVFIILRSVCFLRLYKIIIWFMEYQKNILIRRKIFLWFELLFYFTVIIHGSTCAWYVIARPLNSSKYEKWALLSNESHKNEILWYTSASYNAIVTTFYSGILFKMDYFDKIIIAFGIIIGCIFITYYLANYFIIVSSLNKRKTLIKTQLEQVLRHSASLEIHADFTKSIENHYKTIWTFKKGVEKIDLLHLLPNSVRNDALFDINYPALQSSLLFKHLPEYYLRCIAGLMKHEFYNKGDLIFKQNKIKNKMFVVVSGVIEIMSEENDAMPILIYGPGTCIGEYSLVFFSKARTTIRARQFVELQVLHRQDFYSTIIFYPRLHIRILNLIKFRIQETRNKRKSEGRRLTLSLKRLRKPTNDQYLIISLYKLFEKSTFPRFIIENSKEWQYWHYMITTFALIMSFAYPYYIGFHREFPVVISVIGTFFEVTFVLDFILIFITRRQFKSLVNQTLDEVLVEKFSSYSLYLDFFAAFPFEWFTYLLEDSSHLFYVFKLNRMLKFYKVIDFFRQIEEKFLISTTVLRTVKSLTLYSVFVFWMIVLVYMTTCFYEICNGSGWFKLTMYSENLKNITRPIYGEPFIFSGYYVLAWFNGLELHEIFLRRPEDKFISCFIRLFGVLCFGSSVPYLSSTVFLRLKYRFSFHKNYAMLKEFCDNLYMSDRLQNRLLNYYRLQWEYNKSTDIKTIPHISRKMQEEMLLKERLSCLQKVNIFSKINEGFLRALAVRSKVYVLPSSDIVTYYGSMNKEMFLIKEGFCVYKISGGYYRRIGPNTVFGLNSLFFNIGEIVSVRTLTTCKLISIDGSALQEALCLYPSIKAILKDVYTDVNYNKFVEETTLPMPRLSYYERTNKASRMELKELFLRKNFVNVVTYCKKNGESYKAIYRRIENFYPLKFILMPTTIYPDGLFIYMWTALRLTISFLYGFLTPLQIITSPFNTPLHILLFVLDVFSYVDLYLMFHVCYYHSEMGHLVIHPLKTGANYAHHSFMFDIFCLLPYELFIKILFPNHEEGHSPLAHLSSPHIMHCVARISKGFLAYRLFVAFKYWENRISRKVLWIKMAKYLILLMLIINLLSCILFFQSCKFIHKNDFDEKTDAIYDTHRHNKSGVYCQEQSWLDRSKYSDLNRTWDIYITAFYWITSLMVGLNFNDISVQGESELIFAIMVMLSGIVFFGCLLVNIIPYCLLTDFKIIKYKMELSVLKKFMVRERISRDLQKKIVTNLNYNWRRTKGVNTNLLFSSLHTTLLQDCLSFMYEDTLKKVPLFLEMDRSFLRVLAMVIKPQYFLEGQVIVEADNIIDEFYIVHRGSVEVILTGSIIKMRLQKSSLFGYYYNESLPVMTITATAATNVDILCVKTADYYNILKNYSQFNLKIKEVMSEYKDFMLSKSIIETSSIVMRNKERLGKKFMHRVLRGGLKLFHIFDLLFLIASYVNCVITFVQFSFQYDKFLTINIALDAIFIFKLALNFSRPYYNKYGDLVTNKSMIKKRYLANKFLVFVEFAVNIVACCTYLLFHPYLNYTAAFYFFTLFRFITIIRGIYIFQYFSCRRTELSVNKIALELFYLLIVISLSLHFMTNIMLMVHCPYGQCKEFLGANPKEPIKFYIATLFFIINVVASTGMSDVVLKYNTEKILIIMIAIGGKFSYVLAIGKVIYILRIYMKDTLSYEYQLLELKDYMECTNFNKYQRDNLINYFKAFRNDYNGKTIPELVTSLPTPIANELKIALYKSLLEKSYLFADTEDLFLNNIATLLEPNIYYPGNVIVYHNQIDEQMYFIKRGEVEIITINMNYTETMHDVLHESEMFGLSQGLFHLTPHQFTFRAKVQCEILSLHLNQWEHLLRIYEKSKDTIFKRIRNVHTLFSK